MVFLTSRVHASQEFTDAFNTVTKDADARILKVSIWEGSLLPAETISCKGSFEKDFDNLPTLLQEDTPAYVLVRLDASEWLVVVYLPNGAQEKEKALYASSRIPFLRALGSDHVADIYFATSKRDLTADAYLSRRERKLAPISTSTADACEYQGRVASATLASARCKGFAWSAAAEEAVIGLAEGKEGQVVMLALDSAAEIIRLSAAQECTMEQLGSALPTSDPCYAFFAWPRTPSRRDIILIYSCPESTPVKQRMLYSTNAGGLFRTARQLPTLAPGGSTGTADGPRVVLMLRRVETTDPRELTEAFLNVTLGYEEEGGAQMPLAGMDNKLYY